VIQKIKINKLGNLEIQRNGRWVEQVCPYNEGFCGEHCPLFSGPAFGDTVITYPDRTETFSSLHLCQPHRSITFLQEEFVDEREHD